MTKKKRGNSTDRGKKNATRTRKERIRGHQQRTVYLRGPRNQKKPASAKRGYTVVIGLVIEEQQRLNRVMRKKGTRGRGQRDREKDMPRTPGQKKRRGPDA